ncbi:MAG: PAS domain S-box protein, partial [Syntrophomonadaceae bacterium]|nr:PAS domain S-box protein [Syntrophomonadaceae bacterium]
MNIIMANQKAEWKLVVIIAAVLICLGLATVINIYYDIDIVYTHFFYLPIILTGLWYYRKALWVAAFLGMVHIIVNYMLRESMSPGVLIRALMFITVALVIGTLSEKRDKLFKALQEQELVLKDTKQKIVRKQLDFQQLVIDAIPTPIFYKNRELLYQGCNNAFTAMLGIPKENIIGKNVYDLNHKELADIFHKADQELLDNQCVQHYESKVRFADGTDHDIAFHQATYADSSGTPLGIVGVMLDITERKIYEDTLRKWQQIFEHAEWGVAVSSADGHQIEMFNPAHAKMHGYKEEELKGKSIYKLYAPESRAELPEHISRANKEGHYLFETKRLRKDGSTFPAIIDITAVKDTEGQVQYLVGNIQDISIRTQTEEELQAMNQQMEASYEELIATEEALREQFKQLQQHGHDLRDSQQRLADIINFLPDPTMVINGAGKVIVWNQAAEEITGVKTSEILGKGNYEHALPFYGIRRPMLIDLVILPDEQIENEYHFIRRDNKSITGEASLHIFNGTLRFFSGKASPLYDTQGKLVGAIETMRDITDQKLFQKELQKAKEAAEQANFAKSQFLANMSHEIRTPMNGIMGMTDLTLMTDLSQEQREYLSMVKTSSQVLLRVINDILDYSKIEAGYVNLENQAFNIRYAIHEVVILFSISSQQKGVSLQSDIDNRIPQYIIGDSVRLRQVLSNLIGNAVKFTSKGEIN